MRKISIPRTLLFLSIWFLVLESREANSQDRPCKSGSFKGVHPVLIGSLLVGGIVDGEWKSPEQIRPKIRAGMKYRVFGDQIVTATGGKPHVLVEEVDCRDCIVVPLFYKGTEYSGIAIAGDWNVRLRGYDTLDTGEEKYAQFLTSYLMRKGITNPAIDINKVIAVDMDGTGLRSIIIVAAHEDKDKSGAEFPWCPIAGDYSVAVMTDTTMNLDAIVEINAQIYATTPKGNEALTSWQFSDAVDIDGDGTLEIALDGRYYEGGGEVYFKLCEGSFVELANAMYGH